ncbi:diaminopimelate dehydrogenase [Ruminococcaceae bacterium OttesenSCG-928-L11]|nr:diaminopimelate dehydrogenase [Ruminococcaceae bacterium OttesenSCG-928-L11]
MGNIKITVVGYGNIGRYAVEAVQAAPDMDLVGIVRRSGGEAVGGVPVVADISELGQVDVALLCTPTRSVEENAVKYLKMGIHTVDSFDIHGSIPALRRTLGEVARQAGKTAILSAGWDPGSDSIVRALLEACAPRGITYTNFGPGMSMGHTVAVKGKAGVAGALSMTIPLGTGVHRRMVYVQLEPGADLAKVTADIKADPYFAHDETHVIEVDDINLYIDKGHGVNMTRKGVSGQTDNQLFEFNMKINNPALTSQIMTACARACTRQKPGAYTMIELPMVDLLPGDRDGWVKKLV